MIVEKKTEKAAAEAAPKKNVAARLTLATNGGVFRRSMRDEEGNIVRTMEFPKHVVVEVDAEELKALIHDIRTEPGQGALVEVDEKKHAVEPPSKAVMDAKKAAVEAEKKRMADKAKAKAAIDLEVAKAAAVIEAAKGK